MSYSLVCIFLSVVETLLGSLGDDCTALELTAAMASLKMMGSIASLGKSYRNPEPANKAGAGAAELRSHPVIG